MDEEDGSQRPNRRLPTDLEIRAVVDVDNLELNTMNKCRLMEDVVVQSLFEIFTQWTVICGQQVKLHGCFLSSASPNYKPPSQHSLTGPVINSSSLTLNYLDN
uniref:Uncharacterized protein n=1 Tax=Setaria digitata TaxID=48799 RepID=A0A915Q7S8_9BILA